MAIKLYQNRLMLGDLDSGIREICADGKQILKTFMLFESGILSFGICNPAQGIQNSAND